MTDENDNTGADSGLSAAPGSPILLMFKATKKTKHFNENQKLWVVRLTGAMAAQVRGKYRGSGRYVKAWVKWDKEGDVIPEIKEIPVTSEFYAKIRADAESDEGYTRLLSANDQGEARPHEKPKDKDHE